MAQFLALSVLCCCAAVAVVLFLREGILGLLKKSGTSRPAEPTDAETREILY
jgi:hypothetical protein